MYNFYMHIRRHRRRGEEGSKDRDKQLFKLKFFFSTFRIKHAFHKSFTPFSWRQESTTVETQCLLHRLSF